MSDVEEKWDDDSQNSTSALQALSSNNHESKGSRIQSCKKLQRGIEKTVVFQWVPSHCGLPGNEKADFLAKKGCNILQSSPGPLSLHSAGLEIKRVHRDAFRRVASRAAEGKPWGRLCNESHCIPNSPRAAAVAAFRLLTGHDCLNAYLFRFQLKDSPICTLCNSGQVMDATHLDDCSALTNFNCVVEKYWRACGFIA
ncbi:uncharacterized protein LOC129220834 [Uloborus diversus]|uniref:uncharacterized protein LOC129220834 n=1 Tax=Uloborus diversus TaxID=327109 RepID=UPI00240A6362|nr:uncharacterized protein LOC129220834 [Uloborus diversus]